MQTPITRDKDGNLVISEALIEQLTLGKLQDGDARGPVIEDGRLHIDLVDVESLKIRESQDMTQASAQEVIRAISEEIQKRDTYPGLRESIDAIRFDQISTEAKARAEADSALASDLSALESRMGDTESTLDAEQQARADADSTLAERANALECRTDNVESDCSALRESVGKLWDKLHENPTERAIGMSASKYQPEKIEITVGGDGMSATGEIQLSDSCSVDGCPVQVTDETTVGEIKAGIAEKCYRLLKTIPSK